MCCSTTLLIRAKANSNAYSVLRFIHPDVSYFATVRTRILAGICGSSSLCDILIAGGLCYYLETGRSGMKKSVFPLSSASKLLMHLCRTDTIVDKLMVYAVNRGIVTTFVFCSEQPSPFVVSTDLPSSLAYAS